MSILKGWAVRAKLPTIATVLLAVAVGGTGVAGLVAALLPSVANADQQQTSLFAFTPKQAAASQAQIQSAITATNSRPFANVKARQDVLAATIAVTTEGLIANYGPGAASAITSIIIATAGDEGAPPASIGVGLGQAATQLALSNPAAATVIARTVANEGTADMGQSFASAVTASGDSAQLASMATSNPEVTGEISQQSRPNPHPHPHPHPPPCRHHASCS